MKHVLKLAILCSFLMVTLPTKAGLILQEEYNSSSQILYASTVGQWFRAVDSNIKIAFAFIDMNGHIDHPPLNEYKVTMELFDGIGIEHNLLGTVSINLDMPLNRQTGTFADFDFSFLDLVVGNQYTATVKAYNSRWGVKSYHSHFKDVFQDGARIFQDVLSPADMKFRITPVNATAVPEPSSIALLILGMLAIISISRRLPSH